MFAVTRVWNEGDVIHATVRNLLTQGVDRVWVIDDDSDDETCDEAIAAGATVIHEPSRGTYEADVSVARKQKLVDEYTANAGGDVWWLMVDGDEFPRGPDGATIRECVEDLPPWIDIVGSRTLDHYPDSSTIYKPRQHPVHSIRLARWCESPYCPRGHWKHQLLRVRTPGDLQLHRGHHTVGCSDGRRAREAVPSLLMHHVPMRDRSRTEARLRTALDPGGRYETSPNWYSKKRLMRRLAILDDIYEERYSAVWNEFVGQPSVGMDLTYWVELVPFAEKSLPDLGE